MKLYISEDYKLLSLSILLIHCKTYIKFLLSARHYYDGHL